ncbi:MAG: hypothetical protein V4671_10025 [Armatimonadota bacterium]
MLGFGGEGDEVSDRLLVVEIEAVHGLDEAGVGFIVEGDGHLADDVDEGKVADLGVAAHAFAGGLGAQVEETPGEEDVGFPAGSGLDGVAEIALGGAVAQSEGGGGVLFIHCGVEDGANGLGHGEDVFVAVGGDRGGGGHIQAEAAPPAVGAVGSARRGGEKVCVALAAGGTEVAGTLVLVAAFASALGAAIGAWQGFDGPGLEAVGAFFTGAALVALSALFGPVDAVEDEIVAVAVVAAGDPTVRQAFGDERGRRDKASVAGGTAVGLGALVRQATANRSFPTAEAGRRGRRGEGGRTVGGGATVFASVALASLVDARAYQGGALALRAGEGGFVGHGDFFGPGTPSPPGRFRSLSPSPASG